MRAVLVLWRQRIRRDRWNVPMWVLGTAAMALLAVVGVTQSYGTAADRTTLLATAIANPVVLLFRGLPSGSGTGAFAAFLILPYLAMLAGFMSGFLAVRHTRAEEESGTAEAVAATTAGRVRPLVATVLHGVAANLLLAAAVAGALVGAGLPPGGSAVTGLASASTGVVVLAFGLVAAQVFATARAANTATVAALLGMFLLSGVGDAIGSPNSALDRVESAWPAWLSAFGWAEQSRPYADDALAPLAVAAAVSVALVCAAFALRASRDLGAALLPEHRGRRYAPPSLTSPLGLVLRLTRGAVLIWSIGAFCTGMLATGLASVVQSAGGRIPSVQAIIDALAQDGSLAQGAVVIFFTLVGILASCCAVQVVCHARQEEAHGTAEPVRAAPVGRVAWLGAHLAVGAAAVVCVLAAAVLGAWLGILATRGEASLLTDALVAAGGQLIAGVVFLGLTAVLFVLVPRLTIPLAWSLVLLAAVIGLFGPLFGLPDAVVAVSPIGDTATLVGAGDATLDLHASIPLACAAIVLTGGALVLMRRRELHA